MLGLRFGLGTAVVLAIATIALLRRPGALLLLVLAAAGALSGSFAGDRIAATLDAEIPVGSIEFIGVVAEDDGPRRPAVVGPEALRLPSGWIPWDGPAIGVGPDPAVPLAAGQRIRVVGTARRVVDIGCGLYPLVFPFDGRGKGVAQYVAADRHPSIVSAVEAYAAARGDGRITALEWDVRSGWGDLLPRGAPAEFDVAFLLKLVPVVHRQARELLDVLRRTPAPIWVASGSRISMTKRRSIERRERAVMHKFAASAGRRVEAELVTEDEFAWVLA